MDFDFLFRTATSVYGQSELVGASWDLFPWLVGAAGAFVVLDILRMVVFKRRASTLEGKAPAAPVGGTVVRHKGADRLYHWLMAVAVLTLMFTAFAPILGWKFEWDTPHWISGVVLAILVVIHIVRATIWQDFWAMVIVPADLSEGAQGLASLFGGKEGPLKPGKYDLAQKLYHWGIAALVLALVVTRDGFPLAHRTLAGNTQDLRTVATIVTEVEQQFGKTKRIWVVDRGMVSKESLAFLKQPG